MRTLILTFIVLAMTVVGSAQSSDLPKMLLPSDQAMQEAARLDAHVVKMLPRFLLNKEFEKAPDSEAVLGIRGNGAFYSFSTRTHSWNNIPEIMLASGDLTVVSRFGLLADLGPYQLSKITVESDIPALRELSAYRIPTPDELEYEIRLKASRIRAGMKVGEGRPAGLGRTYLLRAISPEKADILVAFTIFRIEKDGSLELIWKVLDQRVAPSKLYLSDVDLRLAIERIIDENGIFKTVNLDILDNRIRLTGRTTKREFDIFMRLVDLFRIRGFDSRLEEDKEVPESEFFLEHEKAM